MNIEWIKIAINLLLTYSRIKRLANIFSANIPSDYFTIWNIALKDTISMNCVKFFFFNYLWMQTDDACAFLACSPAKQVSDYEKTTIDKRKSDCKGMNDCGKFYSLYSMCKTILWWASQCITAGMRIITYSTTRTPQLEAQQKFVTVYPSSSLWNGTETCFRLSAITTL